MKRNGFTLVEVIVVIGIAAILMAISTMKFNEMMKKSAMNSQVKRLYSEIVKTRVKAMYEKQPRLVVLSEKKADFHINDTDTSESVVMNLTYGIEMGRSKVVFDTKGVTNDDTSICIKEANSASVDSIVISKTRIQMGKRVSGECKGENIDTE